MKVHLAYGKKGLDVRIPDENVAGILTMKEARALPHPEDELVRCLENPIRSVPLATLAARARNACVVISDITRPVPNEMILPPLLDTLERNGIGRDDITILVATGLHRPSTSDELKVMMGATIAHRYRIIDHHARRPEEQEYLGLTTNSTPVFIDRTYCRAELKITTGFIEPHLMAGFSGGRKLVAPGCAGEETIKALHSPLFLENPLCCEGSVDRNPLHLELLEIARMAGHDFIVNVALDAEGRISGVFGGDPEEAHAAGVEHVRTAVRSIVKRPVDIVVTTSAGHPLDLTWYQAVKGVTAALPIVRRGGMIIIAAECAEGLGSAEFARMATSFASADAFIDSIMNSPVTIDQWQLEECAKAARLADVVLVSSGIPSGDLGRLFVQTVPAVEEALEQGLEKFGRDATIAVIPRGPYSLVEVEERIS
jgi:nickel-dependent lactate racemase